MIRRLLHTVLSLFLVLAVAYGQETISADQTAGCDSLTVGFTLNTTKTLSEYTSVQWDFGDGGSASAVLDPVHTYTRPGTFTVTCLLDGVNPVQEKAFITVSATPYADFVFKDSSALETEFVFYFKSEYFKANEGETIDYEWRFPDDGSSVYDSVALHTFPAEGIFEVFLVLTSEAGCSDSIKRKVPVSHKLMPPNVFSPNGDMINDYFKVTTQGDYVYSFRVFTRTGTQVYYSYSPQILWDGKTAEGRDVPEGVYFYVIESDQTPVETEVTGFVHLYR